MARAPGARRRNRGTGIVLLLAAALAGGVWLDRLPLTRSRLPARTGADLAQAKAWSYQLQNLSARRIPDSADMVVVDYSADGSDRQRLSPEQVEKLRQRAGRPPRIVLAYLSIGEAENYRYYWRRYWSIMPPAWLMGENKDWRGNFPVAYWQPGWQRIIVKPAPTLLDAVLELVLPWSKPYLDRIVEAGFDGVYLDCVDAFEEVEDARPSARDEMIALVRTIATYARTRRPGFLIVPQNGEALVEAPDYRRLIDGIAKEDLLFGAEREEAANDEIETALATARLAIAQSERLPVFLVEYVADPAKREQARLRAAELGFPLVIAQRGLNAPPIILPRPDAPPFVAPPEAPSQAPASRRTPP